MYMKYNNDVRNTNGKLEINDIFISNVEEEIDTALNHDMNIKRLKVSAEPMLYDTVFEKSEGKPMKRLVKDNKRVFGIAVPLHKGSDLYKLYQSDALKEPVVTMKYLEDTYKEWDGAVEEFRRGWDVYAEKNKRNKDIILVTGGLYEIRMLFHKNDNMRNVKLKKITLSNDRGTILGFHVTERMVSIIKQLM